MTTYTPISEATTNNTIYTYFPILLLETRLGSHDPSYASKATTNKTIYTYFPILLLEGTKWLSPELRDVVSCWNHANKY